MNSPFPGMDPYLEQFWGDVHTRLTIYASDAIQRQLPGDLQARVEDLVYVAVAEPIVVHLPARERHLRSIAIIDPRSEGRLITSIEFLSPANKQPPLSTFTENFSGQEVAQTNLEIV